MAMPSISSMPRAQTVAPPRRAAPADLDAGIVQIMPGQFHVAQRDERVLTLLGSCVAACVRDARLGIGGMNHFMLPGPRAGGAPASGWADDPARYGCFAMEQLINEVLRRGGRRESLEVKVFGGGRMIAGMSDVGAQNADFVRRYLAAEGLTVTAEDLGGDAPRQVLYAPRTGLAMVRKLARLEARIVVAQEQDHQRRVTSEPVEGDVDLWLGDTD